MPKPTWGEIYFVGGMMALVLVISAVSIYLFVKTYRKEMKEWEWGVTVPYYGAREAGRLERETPRR